MLTLIIIAVFILAIGLMLYGYVRHAQQKKAMAQLAAKQGWEPLPNDMATLQPCLPIYLQGLGDRQDYDMAYRATYDGVEIIFFAFSYTVYTMEYNPQTNTEEEHAETHRFTIVHSWLQSAYPLVLLLHHAFLSKLTDIDNQLGLQSISLEGDFNKEYDSYVKPGAEVDSLTLLTPDVMAALLDAYDKASVQFGGQDMAVSIENARLTAETVLPLLQGTAKIVHQIDEAAHLSGNAA